MNYHEKSAWVCAICILAVYVPYFVFVWMTPAAYMVFFVAAVIGLVALMVGFHAVIALSTPKVLETGDTPPRDEMDRLIEFRAAKWSGIFLGVVVLTCCLNAMILIPLNSLELSREAAETGTMAISVSKALVGVHVLFAGFVLANLVYYCSIIVGYRSLS